jgi:predicted Zn-dependent protease
MNKILQTLVLHSERPSLFNGYHLVLLDTDEFNAFATSGGHILITRGLADSVKSEDELAAVIAHEIGHVQNGDAIKSIKANRWTNVVTGVATSAVSALDEKAGADLTNMVDDTITTMVNNGFSKSQEYDADKAAVSILAATGYNPNAIIEMLKRIQEREPKDKSKLSGMYKTHPAAQDRIKEVTKVLAKVTAPEDTSAMREARFAKNMGK